MEKRANAWSAFGMAGLCLLLIPVLYLVAYFALVEVDAGALPVEVHASFFWAPSYRVADGVCQRVFYPLHLLDRKVRRETWVGVDLDAVLSALLPLPVRHYWLDAHGQPPRA